MERTINFGKRETASFLANIFITKIFLGLPGELSRAAGTASWIVVLFSGIIFLGILLLIFKIYEKNEEYDIFRLCEKVGGKALKIIFSSLLFLSFLVKGASLLRITSEITVRVLPFDFSAEFLMMFLFITMFFSAILGLESVLRIHAVFLPLILASFAFVIICAFFSGDVLNIYPIFGFGTKNILKNTFKYIGIYSDIIYIFLLAPHIKDKKIYKRACTGGIVLSIAVIFLVSLSYTFVAEYPVSGKLFMPIYQISRLLKTGANSQGFEAFLLPVWIISSLLYLCTSAFFSADILKKAFNLKREKLLCFISSVLILLLSLLPENLKQASRAGTDFVNIFVIFISATSVLIAFIAKCKARRKIC